MALDLVGEPALFSGCVLPMWLKMVNFASDIWKFEFWRLIFAAVFALGEDVTHGRIKKRMV